ncbi:MAG: hypothetical protein FWD26_08120 [Treponema sp.]|nr:hypothetical protein [Treponema sp.]
MEIDITYDMRKDSNGNDPDGFSKTLKMYNKYLWSKKLPNEKEFNLTDNVEGVYLYHKSELGEYHLSSDAFIQTYSTWQRTEDLIKQIPKNELEYFDYISYTIGGIILYPSNMINGMNTMNQERGKNYHINDRMDLTLECIRRYYNNEDSPLFQTIKRYDDFFKLFTNFKGYCDYFLLQDLVIENYSKVNFFLKPFIGFTYNILPKNTAEYYEYKENSINFVNKRNNRILEYCRS